MAWAPKEKALTLDEAIDFAKQELAPYWFGAKPMLAAIKEGPKATVHPLDGEFAKTGWMIYFIDPHSYSGETSYLVAREWYRRYKDHNLRTMFVLRSSNPTLFTLESAAALHTARRQTYVMTVDANGLMAEAFNAQVTPSFVLFANGKTQFVTSGPKWLDTVETRVQEFIRSTDPGVPFSPELDLSPDLGLPNDLLRFELGSSHAGKTYGAKYPAPGFKDAGQPFKVGAFAGKTPDKLSVGEFHIQGKWAQFPDRLITNDPAALIQLRAPGRRFSMIGQTTHPDKVAKVIIEVNGLPPFDAIMLPDIMMDDDGSAVVRVNKPTLQHVLAALPETHRLITLRFPMADKVPVALYALLFGD